MSTTIISKVVNNVDCHALKLFRNIAGLFDVDNVNNKFSDLQIKMGNRTFYCHKLILQLNSDYFFNKLFQSKTVTLPCNNPDQFYDVLQFMYTGEVLVSTNNIESLLSAADLLGMSDLKSVCFSFLDYSLLKIEKNTINNNNQMYSKIGRHYQKQAVGYFNKMKSTTSVQIHVSEAFMKVLLKDDNLEVKSEVEVCEMLMKWLQVQTEAGHEVHPHQLLPLIRWSAISVDYIKSTLHQNTTLRSDPASISFLSKVMTYLQSGVEFEGLQTFHRPSTGFNICLLAVGLWNGNTASNEACKISLQHQDRVMILNELPTLINNMSASCTFENRLYVLGTGSTPYKDMWNWQATLGWTRCADMIAGRENHCVTVVDSMLFVLGGKMNREVTNSIDKYDINTKKWTRAGNLAHAVRSAACVAYNKSIYVFGGRNRDRKIVDYIQVYNTADDSCTTSDKPMPRAHYAMRAVLWETSAILLDNSNCYIFNFETHSWQERRQFKADGDYFACTLSNNTVYIAGGTCNRRNKQNKLLETCTNEIRSVSVLDIMNNKPAVWIRHAQLPKHAMILAYGALSVPVGLL